jgi:predicted MFS family arabinose efflux permease
MNENASAITVHAEMARLNAAAAFLRSIVIGLTAFLTVVDLFAAQAILPSLVTHYGVMPAAMGLAVNACTLGMAVAGFGVALLSRRIDRRTGILVSLGMLAIPTTLLAFAPNIWVFAGLRVLQGLAMSTAFSLTLAYMGERFSAKEAAGAFAAYITGNVASNLVGRFIAAAVVDHAGLAANFYLFAALNLLGAILVYFTVKRVPPVAGNGSIAAAPMAAWSAQLKNPVLTAGFGIGFCILFAFIGTFTYINFVLTRPPLSVGMMELGVIYLVFLPAIITTPLAGLAARWLGTRPALWAALAVAGLGLPLMLLPHLPSVLLGMVLVGVGTFFAQALATGFVSHAASSNRGAASGIYLASYFLGGLVGSAILGQLFDRFGWGACVAGIAASLGVAALLVVKLVAPPARISPDKG